MRALIIYDDLAYATEAEATLHRAAGRADANLRWTIRYWQFDALRLPLAADEALMEASDAHLIVLAGRRAQSLPAWLRDWLEDWATRRQIADAALAVVGHWQQHEISKPASSELSRFADRHGLSFLTDDNHWVKPGLMSPAGTVS
jgi:hypothetical protein